jgi:raffinose/stachyose/melibiose transport system substrate-binding protein
MNKKIKVLSVMMCLLLSFMLTACSSKSNGQAGKGNSSGDKVEISFMTHTPETEEQKKVTQEDIINKFEEKHKNIKIKWIYNQDPDTLTRQQLAAGGGPDVIISDGPTTLSQYASSKYLLPLDDYAKKFGWNERYFDWAYETGFSNGKLYGLPGEYESLVVWYNKDMFEKNGWKVPVDFKEFMNLMKEIKKKDIMPFAFGTTDFRPSNEWWLSAVYNSYLGPEEFKKVLKNEVPWTSDLVTEATEKWKEIWQKGYINDKQSHAISLEDAWGLFNNGKAAMKMEGTWATSRLTTSPPPFKTDFFVMPAWRDSVKANYPMALGESSGINSKSAHPKEAAEFLDWLYGDEIAKKFVSQGRFLPNKAINAKEIDNLDPLVVKVFDALEKATADGNTGYASWTYWGPGVEQYLWGNIDAVFLNELTVKDYLKNAQEKAKKDEEGGFLFKFKD